MSRLRWGVEPPIQATRACVLLAWLAAAGCGASDSGASRSAADTPGVVATDTIDVGTQAPGTVEMIRRLAAIPNPADWDRRVAELDRTPRPSDLRGSVVYAAGRAQVLSRAGRIDEALGELDRIRDQVAAYPGEVPADFQRNVLDLRAIVLLWGALERACLDRFEYCLFPIESALPAEGRQRADEALEIYLRLLAFNDQNADWRWLVNIAAMAAGRFPDAIPEPWRIPLETLEADADIGRFPNRAEELGVDVPGLSGSVAAEDFDGDGDLDLLTSSSSLADDIRYFRNDAGRFLETTEAAGIQGLKGGLNLLSADYDNDGDTDVFVLRGAWTPTGQPNSLLQNDGRGRFADVTEEAGLLSIHPTQTGAWVDYDGDGDLDLFIGNESEPMAPDPQIHPAELFRNEGNGRFTEVAEDVGLDVLGFIKGVTWGDYDDDGRPDVYLSLFLEPNRLYRNEGPTADGGWRFSDVTSTAGVAEPAESLPAWFWDYDNDGRLDLMVPGYRLATGESLAEHLGRPEIGALPRLYRNRGDGTFEDRTAAVGLQRIFYTMGSNFGDLDNDGWPDFYAGTGTPDLRAIMTNRVFRNAAGRRFQDVTASGGFGHLGKGHGAAFADFDADGDQDLYVVMGGAISGDVGENVLWENPGHGNRWITLRLEGVEANRSAIGARVRVDVETPSGVRSIHALAGTGGSFGSSSLQQEIGLGDATAIAGIEISWPGSGTVDRLGPVPLDAVYAVREGSGRAEPIEVVPTPLGGR